MGSCRDTLMSMLMRVGLGLLTIGVVVLLIAIFSSEPQTAEEITGSSVRLSELIFLFAVSFFGSTLNAAIALLFGGTIMVLTALIMATFDKQQSQN